MTEAVGVFDHKKWDTRPDPADEVGRSNLLKAVSVSKMQFPTFQYCNISMNAMANYRRNILNLLKWILEDLGVAVVSFALILLAANLLLNWENYLAGALAFSLWVAVCGALYSKPIRAFVREWRARLKG